MTPLAPGEAEELARQAREYINNVRTQIPQAQMSFAPGLALSDSGRPYVKDANAFIANAKEYLRKNDMTIAETRFGELCDSPAFGAIGAADLLAVAAGAPVADFLVDQWPSNREPLVGRIP